MKIAIIFGLLGAALLGAAAQAATPNDVVVRGNKVYFVGKRGSQDSALGKYEPNRLCPGQVYHRWPYPHCTGYGQYWPYAGYAISGKLSIQGQYFALAEGFVASANAKANEVQVAVSWTHGTNAVNVGLYNDAGGLPGTVLAQQQATGLPSFGSCCDSVTVTFKHKVALEAGAQYWIVVTPGADDTAAAWNMDVSDQVHPALLAQDGGSGWSLINGLPGVAAMVGK